MQTSALSLLSHPKPSIKHLANIAATLLLTTGGIAVTTDAKAAFIGYYSPSNWTFTQPPNGVGSVDSSGAPNSIVLEGSQGTIAPGNVDFTITVPESGTWSFDWSYDSQDIVNSTINDNGGYLLNNTFTRLALNSDVVSGPVSGFISLSVSQGDTIGYRVSTSAGNSFPGLLTVSNFSAPAPTAAVPYNFSPGLGIGLLGVWVGASKVKKYLQTRKFSPKVPTE